MHCHGVGLDFSHDSVDGEAEVACYVVIFDVAFDRHAESVD